MFTPQRLLPNLHRSARLFSSTSISPSRQKLLEKNPDDVVITYAKRSANTKAKKGGLAYTPSDELLKNFLKVGRVITNAEDTYPSSLSYIMYHVMVQYPELTDTTLGLVNQSTGASYKFAAQ
jgi:hypothetical protein